MYKLNCEVEFREKKLDIMVVNLLETNSQFNRIKVINLLENNLDILTLKLNINSQT